MPAAFRLKYGVLCVRTISYLNSDLVTVNTVVNSHVALSIPLLKEHFSYASLPVYMGKVERKEFWESFSNANI